MRQRSLWRRAEKVPCVHTAVHIFGTPFFPIRLSALCRYSGVTQPCKTTTHLSRFFVRCVDVQSFIINPLQSNNNNYSQHNNMQQQQLWCDTAVHSIFLKKMCVQTQLSETACFHLEAHHHPAKLAGGGAAQLASKCSPFLARSGPGRRPPTKGETGPGRTGRAEIGEKHRHVPRRAHQRQAVKSGART